MGVGNILFSLMGSTFFGVTIFLLKAQKVFLLGEGIKQVLAGKHLRGVNFFLGGQQILTEM